MGTFDKNDMLTHSDDLVDAWYDWYFDQGNVQTEINDVISKIPPASQVSFLLEEAYVLHQKAEVLFEVGYYESAANLFLEELNYLYVARNFEGNSDQVDAIECSFGEAFLRRGASIYFRHFRGSDPFLKIFSEEDYDGLFDAITDFEAAKAFFKGDDPEVRMQYLQALDLSRHCQEVIIKHRPDTDSEYNTKTI